MILYAQYFIQTKKPMILQITCKTCSRRTKCVTLTLNCGWKLESKLCWLPPTNPPPRICNFPAPWKKVKITALPKPGKNSKVLENLTPISLLSTTGNVFQKLILKAIHRHIAERNLLNAIQFGFRARHSTTLQCMRLTDHVSLNFNNNMSTAVVFLDIEKAFDTTWHPGLIYKLSEFQFPISLINPSTT
jgi:hypothetical protein